MAIPQFDIIRMSNFGVYFDPRKRYREGALSREWWVTCYELEFYIDDWNGGAVIDNVLYPAQKDHFTCAKPGQLARMQLPYRSYYLNISTQDKELKAALDALPAYAHNPEIPQIVRLIRQHLNRDWSNTLSARIDEHATACKVLSLLLRPYPDAQPATPVFNIRRHEQALMAADAYLRTHLTEDVDLGQLAKDSGLHPTYFHKLYTAAFAHTPAENLMRYRVRHAWGLLRDDNMPIAEVARRCGFSSQSYFCRKFKQLSDQTPSQFRQSLRKRRLSANQPTP